jgi:hypothetical protein
MIEVYGLGWCLFFSPGWANDPLFGPNFHAVLATVMTGWLALILMAAAVSAGAIVGFVCALLGVGEAYRGRVYRGWLWLAALVILCLSVWIFRLNYARLWEAFPNGYPVGSLATARRFGDLSCVPWPAEAAKPRS